MATGVGDYLCDEHHGGAVIAALTFLLVHLAWTAQAQDRPSFPAPDRPVARIVSPEYSDEQTRDGHGEAERVMDLLGIKPPQRVADIGAGLGYYTVRLARRLGSDATIYATDVKTEYLDQLRARLAGEGIAGVTVILGLPRDPRLPPGSVDVAILSHMYHEIENPYEFLYRLQPSLAPADGYLAVFARPDDLPPAGAIRPCRQ